MNYATEITHIAQRIRQLRLERGMTIQELAYRCDMERSNMSRIEAGRNNLTIKTICTICTALGVEIKEVIL